MMKKVVYPLLLITAICLSGCASLTNSYSDNVKERKSKMATTNIELGLAYLNYGSEERAKKSLDLAVAEAPHFAAAWSALGYYYESIHENTKADGFYRKAIRLAPGEGAPHNNYGTFLCRQGRYKESIFEFVQAAENDKYLKRSNAYENASYCANKIPDKAMAKKFMNKALGMTSSTDVLDKTDFQ